MTSESSRFTSVGSSVSALTELSPASLNNLKSPSHHGLAYQVIVEETDENAPSSGPSSQLSTPGSGVAMHVAVGLETVEYGRQLMRSVLAKHVADAGKITFLTARAPLRYTFTRTVAGQQFAENQAAEIDRMIASVLSPFTNELQARNIEFKRQLVRASNIGKGIVDASKKLGVEVLILGYHKLPRDNEQLGVVAKYAKQNLGRDEAGTIADHVSANSGAGGGAVPTRCRVHIIAPGPPLDYTSPCSEADANRVSLDEIAQSWAADKAKSPNSNVKPKEAPNFSEAVVMTHGRRADGGGGGGGDGVSAAADDVGVKDCPVVDNSPMSPISLYDATLADAVDQKLAVAETKGTEPQGEPHPPNPT